MDETKEILQRSNQKSSKVIEVTLQTSEGKRTLRFDKERIVIGSVISADLKLTGDGVSPIHAVLEIRIGSDGVAKLTVYDLASETGVFVNGKKTLTQTLSANDEVTIGSSKFSADLESPEKLSKDDIFSKTASGQRLYIPKGTNIKELLLEDEREAKDIFDYRPSEKEALEVILSWYGTILDVQHFTQTREITVGPSRKNHFGIPAFLNAKTYGLVSQDSSGKRSLHFNPQLMQGVIQKKGEVRTLSEVATQQGSNNISIESNDFVKVSTGPLDFYLSNTAAPPRLRRQSLFDKDLFFFKIFWGSMLLTGLVLLAIFNAPIPQNIEAEQVPERIATILYQPEKFPRPKLADNEIYEKVKNVEPKKEIEKPQKKPVKIDIQPTQQIPKKVPKFIDTGPKSEKPTTSKATKNQPKAGGAKSQGQHEAKEGEGAKAKGESGTRGSKNAPKANDKQTTAHRPSPMGGKGRGSGSSQVPDEGNVDVLKGAASTIQDLLGSTAAKLGKGGEKLKGFGGFATEGNGGLAMSGSGAGGGGTAESLGGLGDKGKGGGRVGTGLGASGTGNGIIGGKGRVSIRTGGPEEAIVMGAIDASAVEAALLAHRDEFRLCYEKEINAENPSLAGRVGTIFVIGASGRVTQAGIQTSSLKNANVERCVVNVIKRIDFPIPRGGGIVQVTYPFKFSPTGK